MSYPPNPLSKLKRTSPGILIRYQVPYKYVWPASVLRRPLGYTDNCKQAAERADASGAPFRAGASSPLRADTPAHYEKGVCFRAT